MSKSVVCSAVLVVAIIIQCIIVLNDWNSSYLMFMVATRVSILYAKYMYRCPTNNNLCINRSTKCASCEIAGFESLISLYWKKDGAYYEKNPHKAIRRIRGKLLSRIQDGITYGNGMHEYETIGNLSTMLVYSNENDKNNIAEIGVFVYFHGGAYIGGSFKNGFRFLSYLNMFTGIPILAVDYRLAPEHPIHMDSIEQDGERIIHDYLLKKLGVPAQKIYLIGDSAGAGVVLRLSYHFKQKHDITLGGYIMLSLGFSLESMGSNDNKFNSLTEYGKYDVLLSRELSLFWNDFKYGCRNITGHIIVDDVKKCVKERFKKHVTINWNVFDKDTHMLFVVSEYELLYSMSINAHELALKNGIQSELYIIKNNGIHVLPIVIDSPESMIAINHISTIIHIWKHDN